MHYNGTQIGLVLILVELVYLATIDVKYRKIKNIELIPILIIGMITRAERLLSIKKWFEIKEVELYLIGITLSVLLYIGGFLGGADVKLFFILLLVLDPTSRYGITSNLDCVQFFYYFLLVILLFYLLRLIHNLMTVYQTNYRISIHLSPWEQIFIYVFYRLQKITKVTTTQQIILEINLKKLGLQNSINGLLCWINDRTPMIPFIAFCIALMIFT
jgi:Flp pilus assembly protein protease CpaA